MKLIYCIHSIYNPGGMERVMLNKIRFLHEKGGYEITIVTTNQQGRPPFYPIPQGIRLIDLDINYIKVPFKSIIRTIGTFLWKRHLHKKRLKTLLMKEKADIVLSLYPSESSFIPSIKDGSKKVLELHFNKLFRIQYHRSGIVGLLDKWRTRQDERIVRRFDKFVVLTHEDAGLWGPLPNLAVIPNAVLAKPHDTPVDKMNRVIAVGRLDYQKGFDRLIDAWALIPEAVRAGWTLDIFGQGEWEEMLKERAARLGVAGDITIHKPVSDIDTEYRKSRFIVMTSHFEGFGMVLVEAMVQGIPAVAFDCPCGPKDIIRDGINGLLVPEGNTQALADAMSPLINNPSFLADLSARAPEILDVFSEQAVMAQWENLFKQLILQP